MLDNKDWITVGKITKTHGLEGSVVITTDNDLLEKYSEEPVFLLLEGAPVPFFIEEEQISPRNHTSYIVKLEFVDSKDDADRLVGLNVLMDLDSLEEEEDEDLVETDITLLEGLDVVDENKGGRGKVVEVANYSGNIVLTIAIYSKEILLPLSDHTIHEVDIENHLLTVSISQELLDLNS